MKINNLEWNIKFVDKDDTGLKLDDRPELVCLGITDYHDLTIYIDKSIPECLKRATIMHEMVHAFLFSYGYDTEHFNEESVCNFVASNLDSIHVYVGMITSKEKDNVCNKT